MNNCRAGSGIGLEFVRQLSLDTDNFIFASLRDPAKAVELQTIKTSSKTEVHIIKLDVGDEDSVLAARQEAECVLTRYGGPEAGIDFLINNAGYVSHHRPRYVLHLIVSVSSRAKNKKRSLTLPSKPSTRLCERMRWDLH